MTTLDPFARAADIFDPPINPYLTDPVGWTRDRLGGHLWSKQREIAEAVVVHHKVAVPSCHTSGKSYTAGSLAAWWVDIHPAASVIVITTATTGDQVKGVLWQEIARAHTAGTLPGRVTQREWWIGSYQVGVGRKPAEYNPTAFQGYHRTYPLAIIDEADGVPEPLWQAILSVVSNENGRILAIGNPVDSTSEFARVCNSGESIGWHVIPISAFDTPNYTGEAVPEAIRADLLSTRYEEDLRRDYGPESPYYVSRVLGRHPKDSTDAVIPMSWVQAAVTRWREQNDSDGPAVNPTSALAALDVTCLGVDVARGGADKTVIAERCGNTIRSLHRSTEDSTVITTSLIAPWLPSRAVWAVIDVLNMGAGPVDQLRAMDKNIVAFNAGEGTPMRDRAGVLGFVNKRSAAWWGLRERLHPQSGDDVALPPIEELIGDLTTPKWRATTGGKIAVESKDEIKKRLGRSTDDGDAVVQSFWEGGVNAIDTFMDALRAERDATTATVEPHPAAPPTGG